MADVYDLDAVYAEERGDPFLFRWAGQDWELPHFGDIDWRAAGLAGELEELADAGGQADVPIEALQKLFDYAFGADQAARWAQVSQPSTAMVRLFGAWQKHGGAELGESSASTGSSPSTGRPSKRTSRATTASGSAKRSTASRRSGTPPAS